MSLQLLPEYIDAGLALGASQLFFSVGCPVSYKDEDGSLKPLFKDDAPLRPEEVEGLVLQNAVMEQRDKDQLILFGEVEVSLSYPGKMRGRVNAYLQRNSYAMTITILTGDSAESIKPLEEWGLDLSDVQKRPYGTLCIITSNTPNSGINLAASLVDYYNHSFACHIITMEDRITVLHQHKESIVNQREMPVKLEDCHNTIARLHNLGADVCMLRSAHNESLFPLLVSLALSNVLVIAAFDKSSLPTLRGAAFAGLPAHDADDLKEKLLKLNCLCIEPDSGTVIRCSEWLRTTPVSASSPASQGQQQLLRRRILPDEV